MNIISLSFIYVYNIMTTDNNKTSNKYIIKTSRENVYESMLKGCCY